MKLQRQLMTGFAAMATTMLAQAFAPGDIQWDMNGLVEVEGFGTDNDAFSGSAASDIVVAEFELGVGAQISQLARADVILNYEQGEKPLEVDIATLAFGSDDTDWHVLLGQTFLPTSPFNTAFVNDSLIFLLAEQRETVAQLGYDIGNVTLQGFVFKSEAAEDQVTEYGFTADYSDDALNIGGAYVNNILNSVGNRLFIDDVLGGYDTMGYDHRWSAVNLHAVYQLNRVTFLLDYLKTGEISAGLATAGFGIEGEAVEAGHAEIDIASIINDTPVEWTVGYQQSDDALFLGLPRERYAVGANISVIENLAINTEFWHDEDYDKQSGGSGDDANSVVVQVQALF